MSEPCVVPCTDRRVVPQANRSAGEGVAKGVCRLGSAVVAACQAGARSNPFRIAAGHKRTFL